MEPASLAATNQAPSIMRRFTHPKQDVWDQFEWNIRDAKAGDFVQKDVEAPIAWSDQTVGVVAKLYFATIDGVRENSVRQLVNRIVLKISVEGLKFGYFGKKVKEDDRGNVHWDLPVEMNETYRNFCIFRDELMFILLNQMAAFNTPVNLNFGVPGRDQVASACFLLSISDTMTGENGITSWWNKEALIFKGGAGSGINVSNLRGSMECLSTGGLASGPCAYMRTADSGAGTLKSGGTHRRAAKMVCMDVDHPDIQDFIWLKPREDERMRALIAAGFDLNPMTVEGEKLIAECTTCQNANFSVRVSDEFMQAVENDLGWDLIGRKTGKVVKTVEARVLMKEISDAAWACADPGILFHDTINAWHTTPHKGPITTCNPCAETHLNDDSSCNLAHLNIIKFLSEDGKKFKVTEFTHVVDVITTAMDITCSFSDLPTEEIERNTRNLRQLGIGYANLGAAIMVQGMAYDSPGGRDFASSVTALLTGRCYVRSGQLAKQLGQFEEWPQNCDAMMHVLERHESEIARVDQLETSRRHSDIWAAARTEWNETLLMAAGGGLRNAQASVIAPTGTTSFMMGCDTTGAEPSISLVSYKGLAAGGSMKMVNESVERSLQFLEYSNDQVANIVTHLRLHGQLVGVRAEHMPIFATALGDNPISPKGHIEMLAAIQPFISGAISKTVNVVEATTTEEIQELYSESHRLGIKAVAIYREGSKTTSVVTVKPTGEIKSQPIPKATIGGKSLVIGKILATHGVPAETHAPELPASTRRRLPSERQSITHKFQIGDYEGYITAGMYEDGTLGEIFLTDIGKEGSTFRGMMGAWATSISISLQYGVPIEVYARKFSNMRFEPEGKTQNPEIPTARSLVDYIMRWIVSRFGGEDLCEEFGVLTPAVKARLTACLDVQDEGSAVVKNLPVVASTNGHSKHQPELVGPACNECGSMMRRAGTCYICVCGASTGCG